MFVHKNSFGTVTEYQDIEKMSHERMILCLVYRRDLSLFEVFPEGGGRLFFTGEGETIRTLARDLRGSFQKLR